MISGWGRSAGAVIPALGSGRYSPGPNIVLPSWRKGSDPNCTINVFWGQPGALATVSKKTANNACNPILTHCVGVAHYWIGALLAHRHISRDRDAEFRAQGTVDDIRRVVRTLQRQLREDLSHVRGEQPLVSAPAA